jgi:hypothetical protein
LLRFQLQGAGDVEAVECADAEARGLPAGQVGANVENTFRHLYFHPQAGSPIFFEMTIQFLCPCAEEILPWKTCCAMAWAHSA